MRAPAHNKYTSKTYTERRAERARVEVEDKDVLNCLVLLVHTQLTSYRDCYQASMKKAPIVFSMLNQPVLQPALGYTD